MTDPTGQPPVWNFEDSSANRRSATGASQLAASGDASVIDALAIIENYRTCEFTTVFRDGSPRTWPVSSLLLRHGRLLLCTSIGFPQKAFNIRRNPKVSLLFSDPTGSGLSDSGAILIRGDAVAEDRVIADMTSSPELVDLMRIVIERQPSSKFMSSFAGRLLFPSYYWRLAIYVIPVHAFSWQTRDFAAPPERIHLKELCHVASGR
ncbi:pyridoxamine 5'-phosphate oxidase family protein [Mycobacterium sp. URHB0021]